MPSAFARCAHVGDASRVIDVNSCREISFQRIGCLGLGAFGLLALVAELVGRSLTHRVDLGRHLASPSYSGADYYPILFGVVRDDGFAMLNPK